MVRISIFQNGQQQLIGFDCLGHAEYAEDNDIVCAAASALIINCINSIETFTDAQFTCDSRQEDGMISFRLGEESGEDAQLLLRSLSLGLEEMESNYEAYIDVIFEEV